MVVSSIEHQLLWTGDRKTHAVSLHGDYTENHKSYSDAVSI